MAKTPLMAQYKEVKEKYRDCLLFYRLGDFYELFYDDALTASHELELTLTGKSADHAHAHHHTKADCIHGSVPLS